jgi:methyl-accepting chemotaxis protein
MPRTLTLATRIVGGLVFLFLALVAVTAAGFVSTRQAATALGDVYSERVVPMSDLKSVSDFYAVNIVDASHKALHGIFTWEEATKAVDEARAGIATKWASYAATQRTGEERELINKTIAEMRNASAAAADLSNILSARDKERLRVFIAERLYPSIDPTTEYISKLMEFQLSSAKDIFQTYEATAFWTKLVMALATLAGVLVFGFGLYVALAGVIRPLASMTGTMRSLADGDTSVAVPGLGRPDEIGAMAQAVAIFRTNAVARQKLEADAATENERQAARRADVEAAVIAFRTGISDVVQGLTKTASNMSEAASDLTMVAEGADTGARAASNASQETSRNVQTVAAATEELTASIAEIARRVDDANGTIGQATQLANDMEGRIAGLNGAAEKIGSVVGLIRAIAEQTNLLALNATIEAARAGDAGRGFAVVASEVKALASQTANATDDIAIQIAGIQASTQGVVKSVEAIVVTMQEVSGTAAAIAAAVEEQGAATGEISRNVQRAAEGTGSLAGNVDEVSRTIADTNRSARVVADGTDALGERVVSLERTVEAFLARVAA